MTYIRCDTTRLRWLPGNRRSFLSTVSRPSLLPPVHVRQKPVMINTALSSFSAQVVLATSSDEDHPPENMIDGKADTFWLSTGMFPQEFIIRFPDNMKISVISIHSLNVKRLKVEKRTLEAPEKFEMMAEKEFEHTEGSLQINDISLDVSNATHLRFLILSGYDHFVSVHKVGVQA